jgi:hypothetical protein
VGFCPSDLMTVPNSFVVIVPSPSLSNKLNASLNSIEIYMHRIYYTRLSKCILLYLLQYKLIVHIQWLLKLKQRIIFCKHCNIYIHDVGWII